MEKRREERRREERKGEEKRGELGGVKKEELGEGGGAWRTSSTRAKEVSSNPKLPCFSGKKFVFFSSLSYSFPLFLLAPLFTGCPPPISIFQDGVLLASMYHSTLGFNDGKGEE